MPSSLVALVAVEIPLCIARIRQYLVDYGFPPYIPHHSESFQDILQDEYYDHAAKTLEVQWKPKGAGSFHVYFDKSRWRGVSVVPGEGTAAADYRCIQEDGRVQIEYGEDTTGKNLQIIVKKS